MKWEPYNKDPTLLCGVPERGGYRIVAIHDLDGHTRAACRVWAGVDNLEHERFVEQIAAGLNLLDKLQHEVGNPVFSIETNLDPLRKRIAESQAISGRSCKLVEALTIIDEIQASLEKIKAAIAARKA